mgnify:CR=1 FL=1
MTEERKRQIRDRIERRKARERIANMTEEDHAARKQRIKERRMLRFLSKFETSNQN